MAQQNPQPVPDYPPQSSRPSALRGFGSALLRRRELSIVLVTIAAAVYFSAGSYGSDFNTSNNYHIIMQYFAPWAIIAAGESMLLICGEIDLSAGFTFTFIPFVLMSFYNEGLDVPMSLVLAILVSIGIGVVNGLIRTVFNLSSFITTLGMGFFLEGMTYIQSNAEPVNPPLTGGLADFFGAWRWSELVWAVVIIVIMQIALSYTKYGVYAQAAGGNPLSAAESGIKVNVVKVSSFALTSLFAGLVGIVDQVRVGSFDPTSGGSETMFLAVASAVIGGTALLGGSGTVIGALFGALLLAIIQNGFTLTGVNAYAFDVVIGVAVVAAMLLNVFISNLRRKYLR
jgi:simple sugar transport system permease protein